MKNLDDIKSRIYNDELVKARKNSLVIEKEKYAEIKVSLIMKFEGPKKKFNCNQIVDNIDISTYLDQIKCKDKEHVLLLAIKDNVVQDHLIFQGDESCISAKAYFESNNKGKNAIEFVNEWNGKGAKICNYHNHPLRIAAMPSTNDIDAMTIDFKTKEEWNICANKYHVNFPTGFHYGDWGVVTEFDFFSYQQLFEKDCDILKKLKEQSKQNENESNFKLSKYELFAQLRLIDND